MSLFRVRPAAGALYAMLVFACSAETTQAPSGLEAARASEAAALRSYDEWSEPVNVGAPVSSTALEQSPALSADGLSLYFSSNRSGGVGGNDIWVSHRACRECPWQEPVDLAAVNSTAGDAGPTLSTDGRTMFFNSARSGLNDIYVTHRADPTDDAGWEAPALVGSGVSTPAFEHAPLYVDRGVAQGTLYFTRGVSNGLANDLYKVDVGRDAAGDGERRHSSEAVA